MHYLFLFILLISINCVYQTLIKKITVKCSWHWDILVISFISNKSALNDIILNIFRVNIHNILMQCFFNIV